LIDKDGGGSLSKAEIVEAVKSDQEVITFLTTCGEENLQFLLHPPRLQKALEILDTDKSGEVDADEWRVARRPLHVVRSPSTPSTHYARREEAINRGLSKRVEQLKVEQERRERAAQRADEEFSVEFLNAARAVFRMIDADGSGTLEKAEVVDAVRGPRPS
jgi:Ca2+-binding EF-hand superfamily protein